MIIVNAWDDHHHGGFMEDVQHFLCAGFVLAFSLGDTKRQTQSTASNGC